MNVATTPALLAIINWRLEKLETALDFIRRDAIGLRSDVEAGFGSAHMVAPSQSIANLLDLVSNRVKSTQYHADKTYKELLTDVASRCWKHPETTAHFPSDEQPNPDERFVAYAKAAYEMQIGAIAIEESAGDEVDWVDFYTDREAARIVARHAAIESGLTERQVNFIKSLTFAEARATAYRHLVVKAAAVLAD